MEIDLATLMGWLTIAVGGYHASAVGTTYPVYQLERSAISSILLVSCGMALLLKMRRWAVPVRIIGSLTVIGSSFIYYKNATPSLFQTGGTWEKTIRALISPIDYSLVSLVLIGLSLIWHERGRSFGPRSILALAFGLIVFALGMSGGLNYFAGAIRSTREEPLVHVPPNNLAGLTFLAVGMLMSERIRIDFAHLSGKTLWRAILVLTFAGIFTVVMMSSAFGILAFYEANTRPAISHLQDLTRSRAALIDERLQNQLNLAQFVAHDPDLGNLLDAQEANQVTSNEYRQTFREIPNQLALINSQLLGVTRYDSLNNPRTVLGEYFPLAPVPQIFRDLRVPIVIPPLMFNSKTVLQIISPVGDPVSGRTGIDVLSFRADLLLSPRQDKDSLGTSARIYLAVSDSQGTTLYAAQSIEGIQNVSLAPQPVSNQPLKLDEPGSWEVSPLHGQKATGSRRVSVSYPLQTAPWRLVVTVNADDVKGPVGQKLIGSIISVLLLACLSAAIIASVFRQLLQREQRLQGKLRSTTDLLKHELNGRIYAERTAQRFESQNAAIVNSAREGIVTFNGRGLIVSCNPAIGPLFGCKPEQLVGQAIYLLIPELEPACKANTLKDFLEENRKRWTAGRIGGQRHDGSTFLMELNVEFVMFEEEEERFVGVVRDVSELARTQAIMQASLEERETLLREIQHRVKNNLQIISSLFRLQLRCVDDREASRILEQSQNRIQSIALLHERLYHSPDLSQIEMEKYVEELVRNLYATYDLSGEVELRVKTHGVALPMDSAIPCGLIINELVTNSMKHAFGPDHSLERPLISIDLRNYPDEYTYLEVSDNGRGLTPKLDVNTVKTLGLRLVNILCRQLNAELKVDGGHGASFKIWFKTADADDISVNNSMEIS